DGDRKIGITVERKVAERASVWASPDRFELVDYLHGAGFGGARYRPGREEGAHRVEGVELPSKGAHYARYYVLDVAELLDREELGDLYAPIFRHPADVVPCQIHQHHVLRPLLRVGEHLFRQLRVLLLVLQVRTGACYREALHLTVLNTDEHLRAGADDPPLAELEEVHVGRRVDHAEGG